MPLPHPRPRRAATACKTLVRASLALCAFATLDTGVVRAQTPDSTPPPVAENDLQYLQKSAQDDAFQLACAQLAVENSLSPDVAQLGTQIVQDHAQANLMLLDFAHEHRITVPVTLTGDEEKEIKTLQGLHGSAFDLAYVNEVTATHADEANAASYEIGTTINLPVQTLAKQMRDTLRHHLAAANLVAQKLGVPQARETPQRTGIPIG